MFLDEIDKITLFLLFRSKRKKRNTSRSLLCIRSHFCYRRGINSNYRSKLDTGVHLFDLERPVEREGRREGKAKPARKTERGKKDAETTIVLGNEAWSISPSA